MPKLATPVQYEPMLNGLNQVRPLQLTDKVKQRISLPVGCIASPSKDRLPGGKFLRCDNQGALASRQTNDLQTTVIKSYRYYEGYSVSSHIFSRRVKYFNLWVYEYDKIFLIQWVPFYGLDVIKAFVTTDVYSCRFGGEILYFEIYVQSGGQVHYRIQGFY